MAAPTDPGGCIVDVSGHSEAGAVVGHAELDHVTLAPQGDVDGTGVRVAQAVVERFLGRAVKHDVGPSRKLHTGQLCIVVEPDQHVRLRPALQG